MRPNTYNADSDILNFGTELQTEGSGNDNKETRLGHSSSEGRGVRQMSVLYKFRSIRHSKEILKANNPENLKFYIFFCYVCS